MPVLGKVGIVDAGTYEASKTYNSGMFVLYNGSTWLAIKDNLVGVTPEEGANWKYLARGFAAELLSLITAIDTEGLLGSQGEQVTGQALMDELADRVATKLVEKTMLSNVQVNDQNKVPTSALAYSMQEAIDQINSDFVGYINTQRTIHTFENSVPYTATENCIVAGKINLKQGSTCHVWLGAVSIGSYSAPTDSNMYITIYVPLKAGQAISINPSIEPAEFLVKAYGLL